MATLTGTNLLDSIIDSTGIEPNALIYATLSAKLQQMIDNGTYSKLAASIAISGFSTQINDATEALDLADTIETNVALIQAAADDAAVDAIDFPDYGGVAPITYTLIAGADSTYEGEGNTFTVTASAPVEADTTVTFQLVEGTAGLDDFNAGSFNPLTATILAGETTASVSYEAITNDGTEVAETYSVTATIDGVSVGSVNATILDGSLGAGQTFTLTTGLDIIPGMNGSNGNTVNSGDDTIIGVLELTNVDPALPGTATTYNTTDILDAGDGSDTFRLIVGGGGVTVATDYTLPATFENVEILTVQSTALLGAKGDAIDLLLDTTGTTGLEQVNVTKLGDGFGLTVADTTDVDFSLAAAGDTLTLTGGNNVTAALTKMTGAANVVALGDTTAVAGTVDVTSTGSTFANTAGVTATVMGAINVTGGTTVNVTQSANSTSGNATAADNVGDIITQGAVTVTGTSATTTVNVVQDDQVTAKVAAPAAGSAQTQTVTFNAMVKGNTVTVNGLTFTASVDLTAEQVAQAFANLTNGDRQDDGGPTANGFYTDINTAGTFTSGDASGATVTYTEVTNGTNAGVLVPAAAQGSGVSAPTAPTAVISSNGVATVVGQTGVVGVANGAVSIDDGGTASITDITVDGYNIATLGGGGALDALTDLTLANDGGTAATLTTTSTGSLNLNIDDVDGAVSVDGGGASLTSLTVNATGTASTGAITAAAATSVTVNADVNLTSAAVINAANVLTISGAGMVNLTGATTGALKTVNASANTGGVTMTLAVADGAKFTGGSGNDTLTLLDANILVNEDINLGDGDDTLVIATGTTAATIADTATVDGGNGTDSLSMGYADAVAVSANASFDGEIDNFERLIINDQASDNDATADETFTVNLANLTYDYVTVNGTFATASDILAFTGVADGATVQFADTDANVDQYTVTLADATGAANSLNYVLASTGLSNAANTSDDVAGTAIVAGTVTADGVETFNIETTAADVDGATNTITAAGNAVTTIDITGNGGLALSAASASLTTVDGSGMTGTGANNGLTYTLANASMTVTGGAGDDVFTTVNASDSATLVGGAGSDTFVFVDDADLVTATGGTGADLFDFNGVSSNKSNYVVLDGVDFGDTIDLAGLALVTFDTTQITLSQGATETTQAYLDQAMVTLAANGAGWFQMGGNTFIAGDVAVDSALNFVDGTDFVVMLTGIVDLSTASFNITVSTLEIS